jgi:aromatic ring-opening dioxygenase catalytic subunit (LigB family)
LVDDATWVSELAAWSAALPEPDAILMVSAHGESAPLTIGSTTTETPLTYDFWGSRSAATTSPTMRRERHGSPLGSKR